MRCFKLQIAFSQAMKSQKMKANATHRNTLESSCSCASSGDPGAGAERETRRQCHIKVDFWYV